MQRYHEKKAAQKKTDGFKASAKKKSGGGRKVGTVGFTGDNMAHEDVSVGSRLPNLSQLGYSVKSESDH